MGESRHNLELGGTFVDGGDAGVAVQALASVFQHVAGIAVHLDAVVAVQVGVFGVHALGQRIASRSQLVVQLQLGLFLVGELAAAFDIFKGLVDVYVAGCLVKECDVSKPDNSKNACEIFAKKSDGAGWNSIGYSKHPVKKNGTFDFVPAELPGMEFDNLLYFHKDCQNVIAISDVQQTLA